MSTHKDSFDEIVGSEFSDDELTRIWQEAQTSPYTIEPITPCRRELLDLFDVILGSLAELEHHDRHDALVAMFMTQVTAQLDVRLGGEVMVSRARSFLVEEGLGVLDDGNTIFGEFSGLSIEPWYNIPFIEDALEEANRYRKEHGLHIILTGAKLQTLDGESEPLGNILVPLNHGYPELHHVLRPQV